MTEKTWGRGSSYFAQLTGHYSEGRVKEDEIGYYEGRIRDRRNAYKGVIGNPDRKRQF